MTTIEHGIPKHKYFAIAQPPTPGKYSDKLGEHFVIKNPRDESECEAELVDYWRFSIKELPDSYCLLAYGLVKAKLLPVLYKKYPAIYEKQQVHFFLMKQLD